MLSRMTRAWLRGAALLFTCATFLPLHAQTPSIRFCDLPTTLPRNTPLSTYSPEVCFEYSGLGQDTYTLKAWLLGQGNNPSPDCASTQWCERAFTIDNRGGDNSAGRIVVVQNMDVHDIPTLFWLIRLYNQAGTEVAPHAEQPASWTTNRAPVLNPIGNRTATVGVPLQFTVSASDSEGDALGLAAQNLPPGATFDAATGGFNWPSPAAGTYSSIIFSATQTGPIPLSDAEMISIQVNAQAQVLSLSSGSYGAGEGGPAVITVNRTGGSTGTVSVQYSTANLTAAAGSDYTPLSDTLTFFDGETAKRISVPILNDQTPESAETFSFSLSNPTGGAQLDTSAATVTIVDDDTPAVSGQWGPVIEWKTIPIHMHLLPTGKVMFWDRHDPGDPTGQAGHPWTWDPATQEAVMLPHPDYDIFCSGHTLMADGRLIVSGGHHMANDIGEHTTSVYDPFLNSWSSLPDMNAGRWYPSNTTLASGDVLVVAGTMNGYSDVNLTPQVWQTASNTWRNLTTAQQQGNYPTWPDYYPFMFVAPNGKVFNAGPQQTARYLDTTGTGAWSNVASSSLLYRDYGSSVMYKDGKVLIVGGNPREPNNPNVLPSATAEVIDLNSPTPAWRLVPPMSVGRRHLNATLLPDGKVLVTGGSSFAGHDEPSGKVLYAEMWDPETETWTIMAGYTRYRGYHSNALLLPDARVLIAGGGHPNPATGPEQNAEIYSPPYLFKGARPALTSAPAEVGFGEAFFVATPTPQSITNVNWIRLSSVTHAFNQNQRINRLSFSRTSGGLIVTAPSVANLCPPGHYMLFLLNGNGVPSVARIIRIVGAAPAPALQFDSSAYTVAESAGSAVITVTRKGNAGTPVSVSYATGNGTAAAGSDYTAKTGTLLFAAGQTTKTFTVPITNDNLDEANETINLTLSGATGGAGLGVPVTAVLTVADNDAAPLLKVADATVAEGNAAVVASFTVTLSPASGQTVSVNYATSNGSALAPADYQAASGTLTFLPGETTRTVNISVRGDLLNEAAEVFNLNLSGAVNAALADAQGVCTITDNDPLPSLKVTASPVTEGNSPSAANFNVTLSAASGRTVSVKYATLNGTALAPADYTARGGTLTFLAGEKTKVVTVSVKGDLLDEPSENFKLQLSSPTNATIAVAEAACTITDDDPPPSITITNATLPEPDGGTVNAVFTIKLSAASGRTVSVKYATANGTALAGSDYTALPLTTLTFSPGQTTRTVLVPVRGDLDKEPNETFFVNLSGVLNATIADNQGLGTILNDD